MTNDSQLDNLPSDGISCLKFSPIVPNLLLCSSWDNSVRLYDTLNNACSFTYSHDAPVLACLLSSDSKCFSGGVDKKVIVADPYADTHSPIAEHNDAVKSLAIHENKSIVFSGSWDKTVKSIDIRSPSSTSTVHLPGKVYSMSCSQELLVVAMSERKVFIFDVRSMKEPYQKRESSLKFQTRCVELFPTAEGYAISSIEGRVAVEYVDPTPEMQERKFAFKCHRRNEEGIDTIYPVHALSFHPGYGTLATGGGDGVVSIWDCFSKKRLRQYPRYPTSISSLSFNADGSVLAVASSYVYDQGEKEHSDDVVYLKSISDMEARPKHLQV